MRQREMRPGGVTSGAGRSVVQLLIVAMALAVAVPSLIYGGSFLRSRFSRSLFRQVVLDPIPASVTDIRMDRPASYGRVFRFSVNEADFRSIQKARSLQECGDFQCDGGDILCTFRDWDKNVAGQTEGFTSTVYHDVQWKPRWFDLPSWKNPEVWASYGEVRPHVTEVQVLAYNRELGRAYFIQFTYDGRTLFGG
jgi:hypothetical protein